MSVLKLVDDDGLRLHEIWLKLLDHNGDNVVQLNRQLHVFLDLLPFVQEHFQQAFVHLDVLTEDENRYFFFQTWTDVLEELIQLLLLLFRALSEDQEFSHLLLEVGRELKLLHRSVSNIDLVLELGLF